jgi:hypothetical protein
MWNRQSVIVAGLVIAAGIIAFCFYVGWHSSFHHCVDEAAATYQAEHYQNGDQTVASVPFLHGYSSCAARVTRHDGEAITAISTAILTFVTLGLVLLGMEQSRTTRAQLRAYVLVESASIQDQGTLPSAPVQATSGCPFARVIIKNSGQTPATEVRHISRITIGQVGTDDILCVSPTDQLIAVAPATIIGPSGTTSSDSNLGRALTPFELTAMAAVGQALYVYGRITYRDVFGRKHETNYRLGYAGGYPPHPQTVLLFTQNGNSAN